MGPQKYQNINEIYVYFCDHCGTHCFIGLLLMRYKDINSESRTFSHLSGSHIFPLFCNELTITAFVHSQLSSIFTIESNLSPYPVSCNEVPGTPMEAPLDGLLWPQVRVFASAHFF